jgi:hypothetical protein
MLQDILDATGVDADRALMVGDTTFDLKMAAAAGMDALAVSYGAHPVEPLMAEAPKACLHSFAEVVEWNSKTLICNGASLEPLPIVESDGAVRLVDHVLADGTIDGDRGFDG